VFQSDSWNASSWYKGPWAVVSAMAVPVFIVRIPVRYYRQPPTYFHGWQENAPPRWGDHWGSDWQHQRSGWDRWNRNSVPAPAPSQQLQSSDADHGSQGQGKDASRQPQQDQGKDWRRLQIQHCQIRRNGRLWAAHPSQFSQLRSFQGCIWLLRSRRSGHRYLSVRH
jgi:hypothetical protein